MSSQSAAPVASDRPPADDGFKLLRHMARKGEVELKKSQESTLIVLGDRSAGKTTLISHFLDIDLPTPAKPTLGIEYKFARRASAADGSVKDIAHIWEIAGGVGSLDLLKVPLTLQSADSAAIAIVISLARPAAAYVCARAIIERVKEQIAAIEIEARAAAGEKRRSALEKAREKAASKLADHPDAKEKRILICGVPIVIMCTHFDAVQQREPEELKALAKSMRALCHMHNASLMFLSTSDRPSMVLAKSTLSSLAFASAPPKQRLVDHLNPIFISAGSDSVADIGLPTVDVRSKASEFKSPFDMWSFAHESIFGAPPPAAAASDDVLDPSHQFDESAIDSVCARKLEQLQQIIVEQQRTAEELKAAAAAKKAAIKRT